VSLFETEQPVRRSWRPFVAAAIITLAFAALQSRIHRGPWDLILDAAKLPAGLTLSGLRPRWRHALPCFPYATSVWLGQSALRIYPAGPTEFLMLQVCVLLAGLVLTVHRTGHGWPGLFTGACLLLGAAAAAPDPRITVMIWQWAGEPLLCGSVARLVAPDVRRRVGP
jgi:hypothetical protein